MAVKKELSPRRVRVIVIAVAVFVVAVLGVVLALVAPYERGRVSAPVETIPAPTWAPPATAPVAAEKPRGLGIPSLVDRGWLSATSDRTGIPRRALAAYAGAALATAKSTPGCGMSWNTLAGIGYVESRHGSYGGASIAANGAISPPIFGVILAGGAVANIPDSDDGKYDLDKKYDRAIGPMQMIPQAWVRWSTDGSGDHRNKSQNMYDAVLAAANYLCHAGNDLDTEKGWKATIATYNSAPSYLLKVAAAASSYSDVQR